MQRKQSLMDFSSNFRVPNNFSNYKFAPFSELYFLSIVTKFLICSPYTISVPPPLPSTKLWAPRLEVQLDQFFLSFPPSKTNFPGLVSIIIPHHIWLFVVFGMASLFTFDRFYSIDRREISLIFVTKYFISSTLNFW